MRAQVEVHVRWVHTDDLTQMHLDLLEPLERERVSRLRRGDDRDRFVLGAAVLRTLVADLDHTEPHLVTLDRTCPRCGAQHGPDQAPGRPWHCSVSHSGPFAVADAVATTVGGRPRDNVPAGLARVAQRRPRTG